MSIIFSIIVPVYNVEAYVKECVDSILAQTYTHYEVILVDDGSKDNTGSICDGYANQFSQIQVIHQANAGLSAARNTGIETAKGEYLIFVDGDDYIDKESLNRFYMILKNQNIDVLVTRMIQKYQDTEEIRNDKITDLEDVNTEKIVNWVFKESQNTWPAVQYVVSRKFIEKNCLRFIIGYLHEDLAWTGSLFIYVEKAGICTLPWYYHRMQRKGSITSTSNPRRVCDVLELSEVILRVLKEENVMKDRYQLISKRVFSSILSILSQYRLADSNGKKQIIECIKKHRKMLKEFRSKKAKILMCMFKIIGIKNSLNLFCALQNIKSVFR